MCKIQPETSTTILEIKRSNRKRLSVEMYFESKEELPKKRRYNFVG